ncbi:MAG TPA: U32 family peptidase, partial [Alphaproteobacteria bacterium]|nr:U32 family peptidase [Alphaproteobacteria bacterium]
VDDAAHHGADAVILADIGLLDYATRRHPGLRRHLSVQAAAANPLAIAFYREAFGIRRVVLPRVLTLPEIAAINCAVEVETEVFAFGGMCVMAEGLCQLSSYATGKSPNKDGVCSPASAARYEEGPDGLSATLGGYVIDRFPAGEPAGYPTLCKGSFAIAGRQFHVFEDPTSLNAAALLPDLARAGVAALKIEGRQRGRAYVGSVVAAFRAAIDAAARGEAADTAAMLNGLSEGRRDTPGAYRKTWH